MKVRHPFNCMFLVLFLIGNSVSFELSDIFQYKRENCKTTIGILGTNAEVVLKIEPIKALQGILTKTNVTVGFNPKFSLHIKVPTSLIFQKDFTFNVDSFGDFSFTPLTAKLEQSFELQPIYNKFLAKHKFEMFLHRLSFSNLFDKADLEFISNYSDNGLIYSFFRLFGSHIGETVNGKFIALNDIRLLGAVHNCTTTANYLETNCTLQLDTVINEKIKFRFLLANHKKFRQITFMNRNAKTNKFYK